MRSTGITLALLLIMVSVSAAAYLDYDERAYSVKGENYLLALPETGEADCTDYDDCPEELDGISYHEHHVGPHIEDADDEPYYIFYSSGYVHAINYNDLVAAWDLCMYDAQETLLGCNSHEGQWLNNGYLDEETEYLRIILRQGFNHEAGISIYI